MKRRKHSLKVVWVIVLALMLVGCGAPGVSPNQIPPTSTPTPVLSTATPTTTQVVTLARSAEEIVGTWRASRTYIRFDRDGTFRKAYALDELDSRPFAISGFRFEGTRMFIEEISVSGVPPCGDTIGIYEVLLLEGGRIQIVSTDDKCSHRRRTTAAEYESVR